MVVHESSMFVLHVECIIPDTCPYTALGEAILSSIEKHGRIPSEILFDNETAYKAFQPTATALGINIYLREHLYALDSAKQSLRSHMGGLKQKQE